jgi:hypothetical protein
MKKYHLLGAAISLIISGSSTANASGSDLFNNITNDANIASLQTGATLSGTTGSYVAAEFNVNSNSCPQGCTVGAINLALQDYSGLSNGVNLNILDNTTFSNEVKTGKLPTSTTEYTTSSIPQSLDQTPFTPTAGAGVTVTSGNNYWVVLTYTGGDALSWGYDPSTKQNPGNPALKTEPNLGYFYVGLNGDGSQGKTYTANNLLMEVQANGVILPVTTVPLPGTAWMLGTALIGLATSRLKKIQA